MAIRPMRREVTGIETPATISEWECAAAAG